ncbi:MAG: tetratricopeptide repeat protein [Nitrospirae bacterium]|nr:tetratricopeptide repeat protein [Nitrospirota bacterium]
MRHHPLQDQARSFTMLVGATLACLLAASSVGAEVRTITATGEYRMGDNDTRTDAKRLALLDAKRLALEKTGTYLEGVTEVKNLQVTRDEIKTYTAGIVEVLEQDTRTIHEGETTVVRVDVTVKIDTAAVAKQIEALRKHEHAKEELEQARTEADRLRQEVEAKSKEIAALKSKTGAAPLLKEREQALARLDANNLLARAWRVPVPMGEELAPADSSNAQDRARTKALLQQALALDPANPRAHFTLGHILQAEGDFAGAVREYREGLRLNPDAPRAHAELGRALLKSGRRHEAAQEFRVFLRTAPPTPANQRLIEKVRAKLRELEGGRERPPFPRRRPREIER